MRRQAFGLEEYLVRILVRESIDLVFDTRAVAWADTVDEPGEHRAAVETGTNDRVRLLVGVRDPARHLPRMLLCVSHEAENWYGLSRRTSVRAGHPVARLLRQHTE